MPVDLSNYIPVNERIAKFYELFAQGRLVTGEVRVSSEPDGVPRVLVQAFAYRTPDDPLPGVGWSWMPLPGKSNFTRDSELENTETSAWGRAIASLGILIEGGLASGDEIKNKTDDGSVPAGRPAPSGPPRRPQDHPSAPAAAKATERTDDGGLIGTAVTQGTADFELRESPDGWTLPFRVKEGGKSFIVLAHDELAQALSMIKGDVIDQRVTVWGHWGDVTIPGKTTYQVLNLERIATPDGILPAPQAVPETGLFDDDLAALDAELDRAS